MLVAKAVTADHLLLDPILPARPPCTTPVTPIKLVCVSYENFSSPILQVGQFDNDPLRVEGHE
jgi:hypothetical protein